MSNVNINSEVLRKMEDEIADKLNVVGSFVSTEAKRLCPVDEGRLRDSIFHKVNKTTLSVAVGTNVEYAPYVEYGTGIYEEEGKGRKTKWVYKSKQGFVTTEGQKSRPFLRPAIFENEDKIKKILINE